MRSKSTVGVKLNQSMPFNRFYGERAFSVSASRLWNRLPLELRLIRSYRSSALYPNTYNFIEYFLGTDCKVIFLIHAYFT